MITLIIALAVFSAGYLLNVFYISVLYHRGLTHQSVLLHPRIVRFVGWTGIWITGIDPKAWACMHRQHHMYSDTDRDPHSPAQVGVFGVAKEQLTSYKANLVGLIKRRSEYTKIVEDIPFGVNALNRKKLWLLPYLLHVALGLAIGFGSGSAWIGLAYYIGIVSHPVQGWMVNALAHRYGYRNFATTDQSTNNWLVSLLVFGEGYQNNHHARPKRANFAVRSNEFDLGFALCRCASWFGVLKLRKAAVS